MSTFYERPKRSNELYHWKYKRKYRGPSGEWIYVYDDGSTSQSTGPISGGQHVEEGRKIGKIDKHTGRIVYHRNANVVDTTYKTNTKQLLTTKKRVSFLSTNGGADRTHETVTYGKLHVTKMNTERKLSDLAAKGSKRINSGKRKVAKFMNNHKFSPGFGGYNASMTRKVREEAARENRMKRHER